MKTINGTVILTDKNLIDYLSGYDCETLENLDTLFFNFLKLTKINECECGQCGKILSSVWSKKQHVLNIHNDGTKTTRFYCVECDKYYSSASYLKKHVIKCNLKRDYELL